ncbi:MAG TPA: serine/threonine-protein kinase [Vicinamibacterales bacterium]
MMQVEPDRATGLAPDARGATGDSRPRTGHLTGTSSSGWLSSSGAIDHGRFAPGAMLGGRYRVVERLGRGGMGEVYRADDLKLGQPVALKFLSSDVDRDPARLTQLHTEVRMARGVSHPNVCRVYDIDEVDGSTFLSMEYVDGEDLASLLRRIGRFPEERALEIARQICAGLAAAHERGVVHRDLKPANVMLDGTGKVRLTDFGLAGVSGEAIRAGTPAYMAPEQLSGSEVTARSDIYSLGLVLYEIFTGQRALEGKNLAELINKREQSGILPPTAIVKALDPKIEAAILRCLKPGPDDRPPNALAVAAALPGGDPLAAALAAGETPSPQMVAAAGQSEALHPAIGLVLVATIVAGLIAHAAMSDRTLLYSHVPMQRTIGFLDDRAREIAASFGFPPPYDTARGLAVNSSFVSYVGRQDRSATRWNALKNGPAPVMLFWHRESPIPIVPVGISWVPQLADPPLTTAGMVRLTLDGVGRLAGLEAVPPAMDDGKTPPKPAPWTALFAAAGFDVTRFRQVDPIWVPRAFGTERAAWEGTQAAFPDVTIRVEAAAFRGLPMYFRTFGPWTPPDRPPAPPALRFWQVAPGITGDLFLLGALLLVRNNLRAGRGDRRGAARLFVFTACAWTAAWIIGAKHYGSFPTEDDRFFEFLRQMLLSTGILWLLYIALEPYVRRYSPQILISWTRALGGQIVDARVGRDVLIGVTVGVAMGLLGLSYVMVPELFGEPPGTPRTTNIQFLLGAPATITSILRMIPNALQTATAVAVAFAFGRAIGRGNIGATLFAAAFFSIFVFGEMNWERPILSTLLVLAFVVPMTATLVYWGLLPSAVAFLVNQAISNAPMTLHPSRPYAAGAFWSVVLVVGLTLFGFYASRKGQPLFGRLLRD